MHENDQIEGRSRRPGSVTLIIKTSLLTTLCSSATDMCFPDLVGFLEYMLPPLLSDLSTISAVNCCFSLKYIFSYPYLRGSVSLPGNSTAPSSGILQHSVKKVLLTFFVYDSRNYGWGWKCQLWSVCWNVWALVNNLDVRDWSLVIEEGIAELEMKGSHD